MNTAGTQAFNAAVGGTAPLTSLIADTATPGGSIQFNMTASGAAAGVAADSLTLDGAAFFNVGDSTLNAPSVRTSDAQTYNGPVWLEADTSLASTAAGNISFNSTVDGAHLLEVNTAGAQAYNAAVGNQTPLAGLIADAASPDGSIQFNMATPGGGAAGVAADSLTLDAAALFNVGNSTLDAPAVRTQAAHRPTTARCSCKAMRCSSPRRAATSCSMQPWTGASAGRGKTSGTQTYNDAVGGATPLTELIADSASTGGSIHFNMAVSGSGAAGVAADSLTLDAAAYFNVGDSTVNSPSVRTSGRSDLQRSCAVAKRYGARRHGRRRHHVQCNGGRRRISWTRKRLARRRTTAR